MYAPKNIEIMGSITVIFFWQFFFKIKGYFFKHALTDDKKSAITYYQRMKKKYATRKKKCQKSY